MPAHKFGKIDVLGIHLADDNHPSQSRLAGLLEHPARVHFDAGMGVDDDRRGFDGPQRADRLADEIGIARRVDQIEMLAGVVEMHQGGFDRILVVLFLIVEIAHAGAIVDARRPGDGAGKIQNSVDQRGLSRRAVTAQNHIADIRNVIFRHSSGMWRVVKDLNRQWATCGRRPTARKSIV